MEETEVKYIINTEETEIKRQINQYLSGINKRKKEVNNC